MAERRVVDIVTAPKFYTSTGEGSSGVQDLNHWNRLDFLNNEMDGSLMEKKKVFAQFTPDFFEEVPAESMIEESIESCAPWDGKW